MFDSHIFETVDKVYPDLECENGGKIIISSN
jgi:hypothetical protein